MEKLVKILKENNKTISTMESCTGGLLASKITDIDGASNIFKLGLVTYSNEYKQYFGVKKDVIDKYSVYSKEVSSQMAEKVLQIANSDFSVGITGQIGIKDETNNSNELNTVYISIFDKLQNKYYNFKINPEGKNKNLKKEYVVNFIKEQLYDICK